MNFKNLDPRTKIICYIIQQCILIFQTTVLTKTLFLTIRALKLRSDLSCLWKLVGDACVFIAKLPKQYCHALVFRSLADGQADDSSRELEKHELFTLAARQKSFFFIKLLNAIVDFCRCYCKALEMIEDNVMIWHDLASCYFSHACISTKLEKGHHLFELAVSAVKHCTATNPNGWQHWNLLGNIYCFRGRYHNNYHYY